MKKILLGIASTALLSFFVLLPTGCSQKYDREKVISQYTDNALFKTIMDFEEKSETNDSLNEKDYEEHAKNCMFFTNDSSMLDATLMMSDLTKKAHKKYPKNALILACHAAVIGIGARDDTNVTNQLNFADECNALLDKAVSMDPENDFIRITRGHASFEMPDFFNRGDIAREDYDFLIKCYEDKSCKISDMAIAEIYFNRAELLRREGRIDNAISYFEKAGTLSTEPDFTRKSREAADKIK